MPDINKEEQSLANCSSHNFVILTTKCRDLSSTFLVTLVLIWSKTKILYLISGTAFVNEDLQLVCNRFCYCPCNSMDY